MKQKKNVIGLNEVGADVSKTSDDQQKKLDDRLDRIEAMINNKFGDVDESIQKVQASLSTMTENYLNISESVVEIRSLVAEKKDLFAMRKGLKQGFLQATFNIDSVPNEPVLPARSETVYCAGANWWLDVRKEDKGLNLGVYLHYKADSVNISYDTSYTVRLLGSSGNVQLKSKNCFTSKLGAWGWRPFIIWSRLVNFTNGFVDEKGDFNMEVEFSVTRKTAACALLDSQFLTCGLVESDYTLVLECRRFPVNKGLLAAYSSYFKTLFFGEFREKDQDEVELKGVRAEEFLCLLKAIYPPFNDADVNSNNVETLLRLADCYQVKTVLGRCSQYLQRCAISEVPLQDKLVYAQNYHLSELLEHCIREYKTVDDVRKLRATGQYSVLDKDIKLKIYENAI